MKQYTLMVADSSEDLRAALQLEFRACCQVFCCENGRDALETLSLRHPDVLVLDLMLPQMDGISLLNGMAASGDMPRILALSSYVSPYILEQAEKLGVRILMEKPCSLFKTAEAVRSLLCAEDSGSREERFNRLSGLLLRLGFTAKLRGYSYLRDAVLSYAENPGMSILKELYPGVAALYGVTAEDVEHSIRSAAVDAWGHRSPGLWAACLTGREKQGRRPSNAVLIQTLAECITEPRELPAAETL